VREHVLWLRYSDGVEARAHGELESSTRWRGHV